MSCERVGDLGRDLRVISGIRFENGTLEITPKCPISGWAEMQFRRRRQGRPSWTAQGVAAPSKTANASEVLELARVAAEVAPGLRSSRLSFEHLQDVNRVVEQAVEGWEIADRVRRLALPSLRYTDSDLQHMRFVLLDDSAGDTIAIAAWEDCEHLERTEKAWQLELHGLYVLPQWQRQGVALQPARIRHSVGRPAWYRWSIGAGLATGGAFLSQTRLRRGGRNTGGHERAASAVAIDSMEAVTASRGFSERRLAVKTRSVDRYACEVQRAVTP